MFMYFINVFTSVPLASGLNAESKVYKMDPPHLAKAVAASLPLGSINP
jgi:hypothetical protein